MSDLAKKFYYEIYVVGKNGFSTVIISDKELDDDDVIKVAYQEGKLEGDDYHYVGYVEEIDEDDYNERFNFNGKN